MAPTSHHFKHYFFPPPSNHKCSFKRKLPAQTQPFPFFCGVLTLLAFQSDVPKRAAPLSRYKRQYARINEINVIVPKERGYPVLGGSAGGCLQRCVARVSAQSQGASGRRMVLSAERSPTCCPQNHQRPLCRPDIPPLCRCRRLPACLPPCSSYGWRGKMIKTPGAVQTSQLIPQQAIG